MPQPTYYIVQQPAHSAGDHAYNETYTEVTQTENQVYTEEVSQTDNQAYTEEVAHTENQAVTDYKTEYKIVTEGIEHLSPVTKSLLLLNSFFVTPALVWVT